MGDQLKINIIDLGLDSFWREPATAKVEGDIHKLTAAKFYLIAKGLSADDLETHIDKIKFKLASLEDKDKDKNVPPTPPISPPGGRSSTSDTSYQGPGQDFTRISIWIRNRDEREGASCSFHDEEEHVISQTMINCLDAPVQDDFALLRWSPEKSPITYRTLFRVVPTKLARSDILLGKEWWEDPKVKSQDTSHAEEKGRNTREDLKSGKKVKDKMISDVQSVSSTSTRKFRDGNGRRKTSESKEDKALKKLGKALYQVILDQEHSSSDNEEDD